MMPIFVTNYHNGLNKGMVEDFASVSTVYMPDSNWKRIDFFAPNNEHKGVAKLISYDEFLKLPPLALVIPCNQLIADFMQLYRDRGGVDELVYLTAQSISAFPDDGADFVLTHDLDYHRRTKAPTKMIYFCKPTLYHTQDRDLRQAYTNKIVRLYINNFRGAGFEPEYEDAKAFRKLWLERGGSGGEFFGYDNEHAWLSESQVQEHMRDSMFTLSFKRRETWAQVGNASMLYGVPLLMLTKYRNNLTKEYEITLDTALIAETVEELVDKAISMTFEQYETLSWQARTIAEMYCSREPRQAHLRWFFGKVNDKLNGERDEP